MSDPRGTHLRLVAVRLAIVVLAATGAAACQRPPSPTAALESQFGLIRDLGLQALWNDEDCRFIAYRGESYGDPTSELCSILGMPPPTPMTADADETIRGLEATFESIGVDVTYLVIELDPAGDVGPGSSFIEDRCTVYEYWPAWEQLPEPPEIAEGTALAIDANWYQLDNCS